MTYKKVKVTYKITAARDGWGRGNPEVVNVDGIDCEVSEEEKQRAINQILYPDGGIDWGAWQVGEIDANIARIKI